MEGSAQKLGVFEEHAHAHEMEEDTPGEKLSILTRIKLGYASLLMKMFSRPNKIIPPKGESSKAVLNIGKGSKYTQIPDLEEGLFEEELRPVAEPYSYVRIYYDKEKSEHIYQVIEPQLTEKEKELLKLIADTLERTLEYDWTMGAKDKSAYLKECVESYLTSRGVKIDDISRDKVNYYVMRDYVGFGPLDPLMNDEMIEDISCDGTNVPLFLFHRKYESIKSNVIFEEDEELDSFVIGLGQRCGKQISVSNPILDGTTFEGHRVQATYSYEITTRGSTFTIRRYKEKPFTPVEIIKYNTASPEMIAYLWLAVEKGDSIMICGGTASGKTATMNAISLFIPPGAKVVTMEDTREINLPHENWIPGTTRSGVGERGADGKAAGEIDMYDLVRAALRQRPNYIIVGEVRGKETYTMFQAMATGHTTYSTMHADSVKSMVNRLENPPISTPRILLTALNLVVIQLHARVGMSQVRRITKLVEIVGFEPETNELITNTVYEWDQPTDSFLYKGHSFTFDTIQEMKNMTHEDMMDEFERRVDVIKYLVEKNITDFQEISTIIFEYYREPEETAERVRKELGIERKSYLEEAAEDGSLG